ncbi:VOC family protein [Aeromonas veronii]|uniref:VOC family protein n=1 Tax=Aeromonas veronii TaxID=654 RepID=UPI001F3E9EFC|nr:VOC family protein [Aeromonas veronii]MCX0423462.1 VOC family protein [Aeromonas veronii]WIJ41810.1 VOC family protein [Aeromonas veronii]
MMAKMIHSMIRVYDATKSVEFYKKALDLDVKERFDFEGFSLIYLGNHESDFELELTYNHGQQEPYTHASGYGHLAVTVENIENAHFTMLLMGLEPEQIKSMNHNNKALARFFFISDPDGYRIEFIEKSGRY